jgi:hypothetical protein
MSDAAMALLAVSRAGVSSGAAKSVAWLECFAAPKAKETGLTK